MFNYLCRISENEVFCIRRDTVLPVEMLGGKNMTHKRLCRFSFLLTRKFFNYRRTFVSPGNWFQHHPPSPMQKNAENSKCSHLTLPTIWKVKVTPWDKGACVSPSLLAGLRQTRPLPEKRTEYKGCCAGLLRRATHLPTELLAVFLKPCKHTCLSAKPAGQP